jgi:DNA-binding LacI/PurR family transcriptional regulator
MLLKDSDISRVHHLAHRLEQDIQRRSLGVGDEYITAEAAGKMLGVSRMTANRAMNLLARRRVLVRYRSRGTFIGRSVTAPPPAPAMRTIHFITFADDASELSLPVGTMLAGLQTAMPQVSLQSHCMPLQGELDCIKREVESARGNPSFGGFILSLGTRQVQQYLAKSGLPTVVHGSVYAGIPLPSVESDQESVGRIMVRQALAAGHRRLVWVNRELWRRGDEVAFDGMMDEVHAAGLERGAITVRNTPVNPVSVAATIEGWLDELEPPVALLCREPYCAQVALRSALQRGFRVPKDFFVVYDDTGTFEVMEQLPNSASVRCQMGLEQEYVTIGRMLVQLAEGKPVDPENVLWPVVGYPA